MARLLDLVSQRPIAVLLAVALPTAAALIGLVDPGTGRLRLRIDPSVERLLPANDPDRQFWAEARRLFTRQKWPVIDVTRRSVEEIASAILNLYQEHEKNRQSGAL